MTTGSTSADTYEAFTRKNDQQENDIVVVTISIYLFWTLFFILFINFFKFSEVIYSIKLFRTRNVLGMTS